MKKFKKYFVLLFLIGLFSIVGVTNVKAGLMNDRLTAILTGTGKDPNGDDDEPVLNGVFNGDYILMCKYKYHKSSDTYYNSTFNIYYSLKSGQRKFVLIRLYDEQDSTSVSRINTISIGSDRKLSGGGRGTRNDDWENWYDISLRPDRYHTKNSLDFSDENDVLKQLLEGECPNNFTITAYYGLFAFTKYYVDCLGNFCPIPNEGDPTKYEKSTNYVKNAINKSIEDTYNEIGYNKNNGDVLRTVKKDENYNVIDYTGNDKIAGQYYNKFRQLLTSCSYKNEETRNQLIDTCQADLESVFTNNVKKNVITTRNGTDVTTLSLPKAITNCTNYGKDLKSNEATQSDCIFPNKRTAYGEAINEIRGICGGIAQYASDDCVRIAEGNMSANPTDENIDSYYESESNKDDNFHSIVEYIESTLIPAEIDKPKGCTIFGEKTTKLIKWVYNLIKIGAPLLAIIFGILDFAKSLINGEDKGFKEAWKNFVKRLVAAIIVILLPVLLTFILNISGALKQYGINTEDDIYCIFK